MENPYKPTPEIDGSYSRVYGRGQCPLCLFNQNVWTAVNPFRAYRCKRCSEPLTLALPRIWTWIFVSSVVIVLVSFVVVCWVYNARPLFNFYPAIVVLVATMYLLRYQFAHFRPVSPDWIQSRQDHPRH